MYEFLPPHTRALYSADLIPSYLIILTILGEVGKQTTLLLYTQFCLATSQFISLRSEYFTQQCNLEDPLFTLLMRETKFDIPITLYERNVVAQLVKVLHYKSGGRGFDFSLT